MFEAFKNFIDHRQLFHPDDKILLAVSGGLDSMVMAYLFHHCRYRFAIAHCNFQLRGEASVLDEGFVGQVAEKYHVEFVSRRFETEKYAREQGISVQMAARELRYEWFEQLLVKLECRYLATAHHLNDAFETALFNLVKGTGLSGLRGITAKSQYRIRPLLFSDRKRIESFAVEQGVKWREDQSNASVKYHRNFIRHKVVSLLEQINPDLINSFSESARKITAAENIVAAKTEEFKEKLVKTDGKDFYLDKKVLAEQQEGSFMLFQVLKPFGFNFSQACDIYDKLGHTGKRFLSKDYQLNVDRQALIVSPVSDNPVKEIFIEAGQQTVLGQQFRLSLKQVSAEGFSIPNNKDTAALDFEKLKFPLKVRLWKKGDWFIPLGMKHKKKLSDFMIDEKIPLNLKSRVSVLQSSGDIVWVIGYRIDDRYKITSHSRQVFFVKKHMYD